MANQAILDYLKQNSSYSNADLKKALLSSGYSESDIDDAVRENTPSNTTSSAEGKTNTLAIVALILDFFMPLIGLVLAIVALNQIKKNPNQKGKGLATTALVLGIVFIIPAVLIAAGGLAYFGAFDFDSMTPERASGTGKFAVVAFMGDVSVGSDDGIPGMDGKLVLKAVNQVGESIIINSASAYTDDFNQICEVDQGMGGAISVPSNNIGIWADFEIAFSDCDFESYAILPLKKNTFYFDIDYTSETGISDSERLEIVMALDK